MRSFTSSGARITPPARYRPGHTMVELVVSVVASSILLAGMGSALFVTSRATDSCTAPSKAAAAATAATELASELRYASSFTERTATSIEFKVADRDSDGAEETIRYAWSGTQGDPLTRQYNGGSSVELLGDVHQLGFDYHTHVTDEETVYRYYLTRVAVALQAGDDTGSSVNSAVRILNAPEVAAP